MVKQKKIYLICYLSFILANLIAFLVYFIPDYVIESDIGNWEYVRLFFNKLVEFAFPTIAAALVFLDYPATGLKRTLIRAAGFALSRMVFLLPYYYLYFMNVYKYSVEAISLSAIVTVFGALLFWVHISLLFIIIRLVADSLIVRQYAKELPLNQQKNMPKDVKKGLFKKADASLSCYMSDSGMFDFTKPIIAGIFASTFAEFLINFVKELFETITYLIGYAGSYRTVEIIYITSSFLFLVVELLSVHAICYFLKNVSVKKNFNSL